MQTASRTRLVGLTGGIASGKSTVARFFSELGAEVIDADQVARDVVRPGQPALAEIVDAFGKELLLGDGTLDRKALGARVFSDAEARRTLNRITHPRIGAETARRLGEASARGAALVIYEATLIVENQLHHGFDGLIVVRSALAKQIQRAGARDALSDEEVQKRIAAQAPLEQKLAVADYVIDNDGTVEETRRQVEAVYRSLLAGGPEKKSSSNP